MAILSLKSRKSYHSDTSSLNKSAPDNARTVRTNTEASNVIGDSPGLHSSSSRRRGPSQASDAASIQSRSSTMKKLFGSTRRKNSQSVEALSTAPSKSSQLNNSSGGGKGAGRKSLSQAGATPQPLSTVTTSATAPSLSTPIVGKSLADAVNQDPALPSAAPASGPRPSELFAGKGVQWDQISLTARDITTPVDNNRPVDMQKFLKERRQWIPTFKSEDDVKEDSVDLPKSLEQLSFDGTSDLTKPSGGLMSLRDLEDTHKRKAALLDPSPLVSSSSGTIFEEAGPSTSNTPASKSTASASRAAVPPPPYAPARNQSFRTSTFNGSTDGSLASRKSGSMSRKPVPTANEFGLLNGNGGSVPAAASRDIPQRRSSMQKHPSEISGATTAVEADTSVPETSRPINGRADQLKEAAGVRPSTETITAGFATPTGTQSQEGHVKNIVSSLDQNEPSPASPQVGDVPPRPPKNGQRTPSRQNSQDPINANITPAISSNLQSVEHLQSAGAPSLEKVDEASAKPAPAIQNALPGSGTPTQP